MSVEENFKVIDMEEEEREREKEEDMEEEEKELEKEEEIEEEELEKEEDMEGEEEELEKEEDLEGEEEELEGEESKKPAGIVPGNKWFAIIAVLILLTTVIIVAVFYYFEEQAPRIDSDKDGIPDQWEKEHGLDPNDPSDADLDPDNDGFDFDGDGNISQSERYTNLEEYLNGTNPNNSDSDSDLMIDGWEVGFGFDPLDASNADEDADGDGYDFDGDGTVSESEMYTNLEEYLNGTDPLKDDTDSDGMIDGWEIEFGFDPHDPIDASYDPDDDGYDFNNDGTIDQSERYTNLEEFLNATDPLDPDIDKDTMIDGWEVEYGLDPLDPADANYDNDDDGYDFDDDGTIEPAEQFTNLQEFLNGTNPLIEDTDTDMMSDGWEVRYDLDPLNPSDAGEDPDNDGYDFNRDSILDQWELFTNLKEFLNGTDPKNVGTLW
jgi:hypothetical protein